MSLAWANIPTCAPVQTRTGRGENKKNVRNIFFKLTTAHICITLLCIIKNNGFICLLRPVPMHFLAIVSLYQVYINDTNNLLLGPPYTQQWTSKFLVVSGSETGLSSEWPLNPLRRSIIIHRVYSSHCS